MSDELRDYYFLHLKSKEISFNNFIKEKVRNNEDVFQLLSFKDLIESTENLDNCTTKYYTNIHIVRGCMKGVRRYEFTYNNISKQWNIII